MRVLITGASGFTGRHLARSLEGRATALHGFSRRADAPTNVVSLVGDLGDPRAVSAAVRESVPDRIFHLAARTPANAPPGFDERDWLSAAPIEAYNLLEAVRRHRPASRVLVVTSSAIYGYRHDSGRPIAESEPIAPVTMYGVGKAGVELVAARFARVHGLHVVRARPFNLVGPGEPKGALTSVVAAQVARIASGSGDPVVRIRHRATSRDFTDVRDAVLAYAAILERGRSGEAYNVASGRAVAIGAVVDELLAVAGVAARVEETGPPPESTDVLAQAGDPRRTADVTGWTPRIPLQRSLSDLLASFG